MRFLVDRCAGRRLADRLRQAGHDVAEARLLGPDPGDRALLAIAAEQQRILVTIDKDFGRFVFSERTAHAGIVRLPDLPAADRIALMDALLAGPHAGDLAGAVVTVEIGRARIARPGE